MRKIAIVGMSFRFPGDLNSEEAFWSFLKAGGSALREIDGERWSAEVYRHPNKSAPGRTYTHAAGTLDGVDGFDAEFFGISPREADQMDPQQRLLLELTWEALENGGHKASGLAGSDCAVYMGVSSTDYALRRMDDVSSIDAYTMTGNTASIISNRISYIFDLHGPSVSVDTACSSSLVALHHACRSIATGESDSALAGGINLLLHPFPYIGFSKASMLSPSGLCQSFDEAGDGYVRSEGGAVLYLKSLDQAERDGDAIHAVILASGVNCDGRTNGITVPSAEGQAALLSKVYGEAGVSADQVDYLEAHGTGTAVGDPIEANAIGRVLGWSRKSGGPLRIGSVKSNLGHLEPASGMAGVVKVLLSLKHGTLPASVHFHRPNPNIDFAELNLEVVDTLTEIHNPGRPLVMGVNSFGFGGANAHVLLEQYQGTEDEVLPLTRQEKLPPLVISARSEAALRELAGRFARQLADATHTLAYDVAYSAAHGRDLHNHRACAYGKTAEAMAEDLAAYARGDEAAGAITEVESGEQRTSVALVYSGNGCQWLGMGRTLLQQEPVFANAVDEVDRLLQRQAGFSIRAILEQEGDEESFQLTEIAQPALFAIQVGITRLFRAHGLQADLALGHSVGEVAAAWAMGALTLEQAVLVIHERSLAQARTKGTGRMAAVGLAATAVESLVNELGLDTSLDIAAYNSATSCTLSGSHAALLRLEKALGEEVFFRLLDLDYAFHSSQMNPVRGQLLSSLAGLKPRPARGRFVSTVTGAELDGEILAAEYWWQNIRQPVHFEAAVANAVAQGHRVFLEIGPHPVLRAYLNEILRAEQVDGHVLSTMTRKGGDRTEVLGGLYTAHLLGCPLAQEKVFPVPGRHVPLPNYPWQRQRYWYPRTNESYGLFERSKQHPLLGYPLSEQAGQWENQLDTALLPYLADHEVGGAVVLPAAAFVEMALAASQLAFGHASHTLEEMEIHAPVVLEAESSKTLRFELDLDRGDFRIRSKTRLSDDPWTVNVVGHLLGPPLGQHPPAVEIAVHEATAAITADQHYAMAAAVGLNYGEAFQGVVRAWSDPSSAWLELQPAARLTPDADRYLLHPGILDACFQSLIDIFARQDQEDHKALIPIQVGRLRSFAAADRVRYCRTRVERRSPRSVVASFLLLDESGNPVVSLEQCRFRELQFVHEGRMAARQWRATAQLMPLPGDVSAIDYPPFEELAGQLHQRLLDSEDRLQRADYYGQVQPLFDALVAAFCHEALQTLLDSGEYQGLDDLISVLGNDEDAGLQLDWLLRVLREDGLLQEQDGVWCWGETGDLPSAGTIWQTLLGEYPASLPELVLAARVGRNLPALLTGELAREAFAADIDSSTALDQLQGDSLSFAGVNEALRSLIDRLQAACPPYRRLRILEISGTGAALSRQLLPRLSADHADYWIAATDATGVAAIEGEFAHLPFVRVAAMDAQTRPGEWFEAPDRHFDLVLIPHVLHRLDRPDAVLENLRTSLVEGGLLLALETPPDRLMDLVFGVDDAWWLRRGDWDAPRSSLLPPAGWESLLSAAGLAEVMSLREPKDEAETGPSLLLARQGAVVQPVEITGQQHRWCLLADGAESLAQAEAVAATLTSAGQQSVQVVRNGTRFIQDAPGRYRADLDSPQGVADCLDGLAGQSQAVDRVVDLRPLDANQGDLPVTAERHAVDMLHLVQGMVARACAGRLWLVTRGAAVLPNDPSIAYQPQVNPALAPLWGVGRVVQNEHPDLGCTLLDVDLQVLDESVAERLAVELLADSPENEVVLGPQARHVSRIRLEEHAVGDDDVQLPEYRLDFTAPGLLKHLQWQGFEAAPLAADEVAIRPHAAGLNFRDVMFAMGLLSDEAVENGFAGPTLGMEVSGIVTEVGEDVSGFSVGMPVLAFAPACFSSRVVTKAHSVAVKPEQWSFEEAATVPTVFFTVYYGLSYLARLRPGERVLIHGAAGGVGIAAIQLARHLGAEVFATAGSDEKRDFVHLLGADHVMDSRSLAFADEVMALTGGEGVDVVVNSLAGEAITRNLKILRPFGRFLELGKRDFYENTPIGLRPFRNNITYYGIDADQLMIERPELARELFQEMMQLFAEGVLRPLPHRVFPAHRVEDAFRYMQQSRQIGKIVIDLAEERPPVVASARQRRQLQLDAQGSYLVTGGLSGFGLQTARWLADRGAGTLVLVNRSGQVSDEAAATIGELTEQGVEVHALACDVTEDAQLARLFEDTLPALAPLKGVVHAAMVLDDALLANLDDQRFRRAMEPKSSGAWNLHQRTRSLALDLFVMFSSATTLLGNPGQANYVAGNLFMESLAMLRRAEGLPATAVCWGGIADTGYLARNAEVKDILQSRTGGMPLTAETALATLEQILLEDRNGIAVMDFDWRTLNRYLPVTASPKFDLLRHQFGDQAADLGQEEDIHALIAGATPEEAVAIIADLVSHEVAGILRLPVEKIDHKRSLFDLGMDSLMGVELMMGIEERFGITIPMMALSGGPSIQRIAERLIKQLMTAEQGGEMSGATQVHETLSGLAEQHAEELSEEDVRKLSEDLAGQSGKSGRLIND